MWECRSRGEPAVGGGEPVVAATGLVQRRRRDDVAAGAAVVDAGDELRAIGLPGGDDEKVPTAPTGVCGGEDVVAEELAAVGSAGRLGAAVSRAGGMPQSGEGREAV